ncbi:MAG: hypothetical protein OEQ53_20110, partial [Saprospiraceae bacterium]|nr:hypothetical protein [Saprospiraceae bacterium]
MILRDDLSNNWGKLLRLLWAIPLLVLISLFPWNTPTQIPQTKSEAVILFDCDLESVEGEFFKADTFGFDGVTLRSTEASHSSRHSLRLTSNDPFGLTTQFAPADYSASYHLTVWRYNPNQVDSWLVAAGLDAEKFYLASKGEVIEGKDDWEQLHLI